MAYKYFLSGSPVAFYSPQEAWLSDFASNVNAEFDLASDAYTIREETYFASNAYQDVKVRINTAVDTLTGIKLGDDFKTLLFNSDHHAVTVGERFYFDKNYWLCVNANSLKSLVNSVMVRRCNNMLRWTNTAGSSISEPCIIDYKIATPDNKNKIDPIIPDGTIQVIAQLNAKTDDISENQRFLFGRPGMWVCYRIYGGGLAPFLNNQTADNTSARLVQFAMGKHFVNAETDNVNLGIADYYRFPATPTTNLSNLIRILPVSGSIISGSTVTYSCYLMSGATPQADVFTFAASGTVPTDHYTLTSVDGNHFSVENVEKYLEAPLIITCTSGANQRTFEVYLRGAW